MVKSTLLSRRDLDFLLYEWLRVDELTKRERFAEHSRETFDGVLDLCEQLATRYFAPHNKKSDANEPSFDGDTVTVIPEVKEALDAFAKADLMGMAMDQGLGGAQLPVPRWPQAGFAWFSAANVSTTGYLMLTMANANLLAKFGTQEQIEAFVKPMLAGRFSGTMALSETQAGSSLADILTRAEPQDDGTYRLFGSKMWISGRRARDSPTTSSTWCWPRSPAVRRARRASRCSSCRSSSSTPTARSVSATTWCWPG